MFTLTALHKPVINNINNNQANGMHAMPLKDGVSDSTSTLELSREIYSRTLPTNSTTVPTVHNTYNWQARRNITQVTSIPTGLSSNYMNGKKWYGNRDASQVTANRRTTQVGVGTLNASGNNIGFTSNNNINDTRDALRRVRSGGAVAPAKKGANRNNAPTPTFSPAVPDPNSVLASLYGIKRPVLYH